MLCNKVGKLLSEYFDGVLGSEYSIEISRHLKECAGCRKELDGLYALREELQSMHRVPAPDYIFNLVRTRLNDRANNTWFRRIKAAVEFRWSRIRTTGIQFYWTKALGIAMAAFCFSFVSNCLDPFYQPGYVPPVSAQYLSSEYGEQVVSAISKRMGFIPIEQHLRNNRYYPAVNPLYLDNLCDSIPEIADEENLSFAATINSDGTMKLENVLEYPGDRSLLNSLNDFIGTARGRPASMNGKSVSFPAVFKLIWITVSAD